MTEEMRAFFEQLDAAKDVAHHYDCFVCQEFAGFTPVVIAQDYEGGVRATIVVVCKTCAKELPNDL